MRRLAARRSFVASQAATYGQAWNATAVRQSVSFATLTLLESTALGGGKFESPQRLADAVLSHWPQAVDGSKLVVCTGGEPLLQLDDALVEAFHRNGFEIAIETNGTQVAPIGLDWVCVSPKADAPLVLTTGDELKLVFPQARAMPDRFVNLAFRHFFLQPMDGPAREANTRAAVNYCLAHPRWRLSLQTHKYLNIP